MNKSKKQIWVVWHIDEWGKYIFPALITTSITKVKSFLLNKIKLGEEVYNSTVYSKSKMMEIFRFDFKNHERRIINDNLHYFQYDYYYDGEEI